MEQRISLREANQHLSCYIEAAQQGQEIITPCRGQPVARLVAAPVKRTLSAEQPEARKRSLERMRRGYSLDGQPIRRDELARTGRGPIS